MGMPEAEIIIGPPLPVEPVTVPSDGASHNLTTGPGRFFGWSLRESTGTGFAQVEIIDGADDNGRILAEVVVAQSSSETIWLGPHGAKVQTGLRARAVAGKVTGALWVALPTP